MKLRTQAVLATILSLLIAVATLMDGNWAWFTINAVCIVMLIVPYLKDFGYYYNQHIVRMVIAAPVATLVLAGTSFCFPIGDRTFLDVTDYTYLSAIIQAYQCFVIGFMVALIMDRSFGMTMTPAWMMIFSLAFAMTLSAADMFLTFAEMYVRGYPVFNEDFVDGEIYTNDIIMTMPMTTASVSLFLAIVVGKTVSSHDKSAFIVITEGSR